MSTKLGKPLVGWKKCIIPSLKTKFGYAKKCLVKLEIPAGAYVNNTPGSVSKNRASSAIVRGIYTVAGKTLDVGGHRVTGILYPELNYNKIGQRVKPDGFSHGDEMCSKGIHFYESKSEARSY